MRWQVNARFLAASGEGLMKISALPGKCGAWIILLLTVIVIFAVVGAQLGWSQLASWGVEVPLFGDHLSMTGVAELQWHLFALMVMLAGAYTMSVDQHIRVDVLSARFSPRLKTAIDICGDALLLIPFFGLLFWYSLDFVSMSYTFSEQSNSGGLIDRYLVKSVLSIGSALVLLCAVGRVIRNLAWFIDPELSTESTGTLQDDVKEQV